MPWTCSTGPQTEAGKARSCRNADKGLGHGEGEVYELLAQLNRSLKELGVLN
jgi:hypothetical protein